MSTFSDLRAFLGLLDGSHLLELPVLLRAHHGHDVLLRVGLSQAAGWFWKRRPHGEEPVQQRFVDLAYILKRAPYVHVLVLLLVLSLKYLHVLINFRGQV